MTLRYNIEIELSDMETDIPTDGQIRRAVSNAIPQNTGVTVNEIRETALEIIKAVEKETVVGGDCMAKLPARLLTKLLLCVKGK